jgi:hypothetical protein
MKRLTKQERDAMRKLASMGGKASAGKLSKAQRKERSRKALLARWSNKKKKAGKK